MLLDVGSVLILMALIFFGTVVSAFAGFAGLGGAGAILLHVLPPQHVIPLIMLCSIATQASCLLYLRPHVNWRLMAGLVTGGLMGLPIALHTLPHVNSSAFRQGFGWLLIAYSSYTLVSSHIRPPSVRAMRLSAVPFVGFAGGLIGGMTGMPGAVPTVWCDLHGVTRFEQRGIVQPFMLVTQIVAILVMLQSPSYGAPFWNTFVIALPAIASGIWIGLKLFKQVEARHFQKAILILLTLSGATLIL
jgi:uncharacterized membrane protein YfcA